jgi:hypothetical protein
MAMREPVQLARIAYATLPRDIIRGGLSAEDWTLLQQVLDLIRGAIPPGQQFAAGGGHRRYRNRAARTFLARDRGLNPDCGNHSGSQDKSESAYFG